MMKFEKWISAVLFMAWNLIIATNATKSGENARWLVQQSRWATLSWLEGGAVSNTVTLHAEKEGRIFIYIPYGDDFKGAITFSEASVYPEQYEGAKCGADGTLDPEDPRCGKLTASCSFSKCDNEESCKIGKAALLAANPKIEQWDEEKYTIQECSIDDLWMIADFGGGSVVDKDDYFISSPIRNKSSFDFGDRKLEGEKSSKKPEFDSPVSHARWLVSKSLWTTISTSSQRFEDVSGWGNIRSVVDGECLFTSKGVPVFYLPTPDPTNIDVEANSNIALSFSDATLPELVNENGSMCESPDPEAPSCAKISLQGNAVLIEGAELESTKKAFAKNHPRAEWLSSGGAHTGGNYFKIEISKIEFFQSISGGMEKIAVDDYLNWKPSTADFPDEDFCSPPSPSELTHEHGQHGLDSHAYGSSYHSNVHGKSEQSENNVVVSISTITAFFIGMLIGVGLWGPVVYHKCAQQSLPRSGRAYNSVGSEDGPEKSNAIV